MDGRDEIDLALVQLLVHLSFDLVTEISLYGGKTLKNSCRFQGFAGRQAETSQVDAHL